jgi:5,10-methylene-tetrahydrofolate dehydrogenase/methenyl tetrahydrofolate cyclohydrolase
VQLPDDIIVQAFATSRIIAQLAVDGGKMSGNTAEGVSGATAAAGTGSGGPVIIDGKRTAETIHGELKSRIAALTAGGGRAPGLAVVLVGARTDSATYVRMKKKACSDVGIRDFGRDLPAEATTEEIVAVVRELNANPEVDGILVQLPLPGHVDENSVLDAISHEKDVDGIHPLNVGFLASKGCIELLKRYGIPIDGRNAVVLGRSNIVGVPVSQLLLRENATVTVCHSRTKDIGSIVRGADIVVAAIGKANFVKGEWLKPGATVIDVGINSVPDASKKSG